MKKPQKPFCEKCRFAEFYARELLCHRYPPSMTQQNLLYWRPHFTEVGMLKDKLQWCGEFKART